MAELTRRPDDMERITTPELAKKFIDEQVELMKAQIGDKKVLLALSGGVDSSVVAALLIKAVGKQLVCVHVNHGLRDNADNDEKLCIRLCEDLCIPLKVFHFDVRAESKSMGRGLEETGRLLRYRAFNEYADEISRDLDMPGKKVRTRMPTVSALPRIP